MDAAVLKEQKQNTELNKAKTVTEGKGKWLRASELGIQRRHRARGSGADLRPENTPSCSNLRKSRMRLNLQVADEATGRKHLHCWSDAHGGRKETGKVQPLLSPPAWPPSPHPFT